MQAELIQYDGVKVAVLVYFVNTVGLRAVVEDPFSASKEFLDRMILTELASKPRGWKEK